MNTTPIYARPEGIVEEVADMLARFSGYAVVTVGTRSGYEYEAERIVKKVLGSVYGVEPEGASDCAQSLTRGR